jgi:hypothetical protein
MPLISNVRPQRRQMQTSDIVALLALVVSLVSFWLSYRAARLIKLVAAAEKRTQSHVILIGVLLEAEELLRIVRKVINSKGSEVALPIGLDGIESQLAAMVTSIPKRLTWLRTAVSEDPVILEEYKAYALEVESRIHQISPMIRELPLERKPEVEA